MVFTKLTDEQKEQIKGFEVTYGNKALPSLRAMLMRGTGFDDASKVVLESPPKEPKEKKSPKESKEKKQKVEPEEELPVIDLEKELVEVKPKRVYKKKPKESWEDGLEQELRTKQAKEQGTEEIVLEELVVKKPRNERSRKLKNDLVIVV